MDKKRDDDDEMVDFDFDEFEDRKCENFRSIHFL